MRAEGTNVIFLSTLKFDIWISKKMFFLNKMYRLSNMAILGIYVRFHRGKHPEIWCRYSLNDHISERIFLLQVCIILGIHVKFSGCIFSFKNIKKFIYI